MLYLMSLESLFIIYNSALENDIRLLILFQTGMQN